MRLYSRKPPKSGLFKVHGGYSRVMLHSSGYGICIFLILTCNILVQYLTKNVGSVENIEYKFFLLKIGLFQISH